MYYLAVAASPNSRELLHSCREQVHSKLVEGAYRLITCQLQSTIHPSIEAHPSIRRQSSIEGLLPT